MKIVDRKTFLAMPEGTLFQKYKPQYFEALSIKGETLWKDFITIPLGGDSVAWTNDHDFGATLDDAEQGQEVAIDHESCGRDGCFDEEQLFAVFSEVDHEQLIGTLQKALDTARATNPITSQGTT